MFLTILGGLAFLGCQAWEWTHLHGEGAWWGRNPFPNTDGTQSTTNFTNFFFTITGFHGFHVFSGVIINIIMLIKTCGVICKDRPLPDDRKGRTLLAFCGPGMGICIYLFLSVII